MPAVTKAGEDAGEGYSEGFKAKTTGGGTNLATGILDNLRSNIPKVGLAGGDSGKEYARQFKNSANPDGEGIGRKLGEDLIDGVRDAIEAGIPQVNTSLGRIGGGGGQKEGILQKIIGGDKQNSSGIALRRAALQIDAVAVAAGFALGSVGALSSGLFSLGAAAAQAGGSLIVVPSVFGAIIQSTGVTAVAFQGVGDALKAAGEMTGKSGEEAAKAAEAFEAALAKLPAPAQEFVRYLVSIKDQFKGLQEAAGAELFPKLITGIQEVLATDFLGVLERGFQRTGEAVGNVALSLSGLLADPFFQGNFATVMSSNADTTETLGAAAVNLAGFLTALFAAAAPLVERFSAFAFSLSETARTSLDTQKEIDNLSGKFDRSGDAAAQLYQIISNLFQGIANLGRAALPAGQELLTSLEGVTAKLAALDDEASQGKLGAYFDGVATNVQKLGDLFLGLGGVILGLGADQGIGVIADQLRTDLLPIIEDLLNYAVQQGPAITDAIVSIAGAFSALSQTGALEAFVGVLGTFADIVTSALSNPVLGPILKSLIVLEATLVALSVIRNFSGIGLLATSLGTIGPAALGATKALVGIPAAIANNGFKATLASAFSFGGAKTGIADLRKTAADSFAAIQSGAATAGGKLKTFGSSVASGVSAFASMSKAAAISAANTARAAAAATAHAVATRAQAVAARVAAIAQAALNVVMSLNPIALVLIAITALVAGFVILYKNSETFRAGVQAVFGAIKDFVLGAVDAILNFVRTNWPIILTIIAGPLGALAVLVIKNWDTIKTTIFGAIAAVLGFLGRLRDGIIGIGANLFVGFISGASRVYNDVAEALSPLTEFIRGIAAAIIGFGANLWLGYTTGVGFVRDLVISVFTTVVDFLVGVVARIVAFGANLWDTYTLGVAIIYAKVVEVFGAVVAYLTGVIAQIVAFGLNVWVGFTTGLQVISDVVQAVFAVVLSVVSGVVNSIIAFGASVWAGFTDGLTVLGSLISVIWAQIIITISTIVANVVALGATMWAGFLTGLNALGELISTVWYTITTVVSAAVAGIVAFGATLWEGFLAGLNLFASAIPAAWETIKTIVGAGVAFVVGLGATIWNAYVEGATALYNAIMVAWDSIKTYITQKVDEVKLVGGLIFDTVITATTAMLTWVTDKFIALVALASGLKARVTEAIGDLFQTMRDLITAAVTWVTDRFVDTITLVAGLKARVDGAIGDLFLIIRTLVSAALDWVTARFTDTITLVAGLKARVDGAIGDVFLVIRTKVSEALTWITDRFTDAINLVRGMQQRVNDAIGDIFGIFRTKASELATALGTAFTNIVEGIKGIWETLPGKIVNGANAVINAINKHLVQPLNAITSKFGLDIPDIKVIGRKDGGPVGNVPGGGMRGRPGGMIRGPGGPRDDRVLVAASNGEFYVNAKQAKKHRALLEKINAGSKITFPDEAHMGGADDSFLGDLVAWSKDLIARGAAKSATPIVAFAKKFMPDGLLGDFGKVVLDKLTDKVREWGKKKDDDIAAAAAAAAGTGGYIDDGSPLPSMGGWNRPGRGGRVTSEFGMRTNPVSGKYKLHNGIDIAGFAGSLNRAAAAGRVISAGRSGGYGNFVQIRHANGYTTGYAHNNSLMVRVGQNVAAGQAVGVEGATGNVTGKHLHFNVMQPGGGWVNPRRLGVFDNGGLANGMGYMPKATLRPERVLSPQQTQAFDKLVFALTRNKGQFNMLLNARRAAGVEKDRFKLVKIDEMLQANRRQFDDLQRQQTRLRVEQDVAIREAARSAQVAAAAASATAPTPAADSAAAGDKAGAATNCGPRTVINVNNYYPVAEPTSITTNRALQYAAALGDI